MDLQVYVRTTLGPAAPCGQPGGVVRGIQPYPRPRRAGTAGAGLDRQVGTARAADGIAGHEEHVPTRRTTKAVELIFLERWGSLFPLRPGRNRAAPVQVIR